MARIARPISFGLTFILPPPPVAADRSHPNFTAGDPMVRPHLAQLRADPFAALDRDRAARMKHAARWRIDRARHLALDAPEMAGPLNARIGYRPRGEESLGVRVERVIEQLVAR